MLPMLVPLVGIKGVIPVIAVAMLLGSTSRLWVFRHSVQWPIVGRILIGASFRRVAGGIDLRLVAGRYFDGFGRRVSRPIRPGAAAFRPQ